MAKVSSIQKNLRRWKLVARFKATRDKLKAKIYSDKTPPHEIFAAVLKLSKLPRDSSPTRLRHRCNITGRPRGYYRKFGLCRNILRENAAQGLIPGLVKSSL